MPGIEPGSREFDRDHTTSLVGSHHSRPLCSQPTERGAGQSMVFGSPYRRGGSRTPMFMTSESGLSEGEPGQTWLL